jgi:hypothetical protein
MANFAQLNDDNIVIQVIVVNNDVITFDGIESEQAGINFCSNLLGGRWIQTSYNSNIRKNYAGIDYLYDPIRDAFIPPKPTEGEWVLNEDTCLWEDPNLLIEE